MSTPLRPIDRSSLLAAVEAAGLLSPNQFLKATAVLSDAAASPAEAAASLVAAGILTQFQADRLLAGRVDGFVLDPYVIQELIGQGAAGRVYKAVHRTMNRVVAIKVLSTGLTRGESARQAFQREVRAAAKLNHPNVVTAYDANAVGDRSYLVMEFVDGPTLEALVRERGPLPAAEACELVRQTAVGLGHAHDLGMVHRDVKPANLLVTRASASLPGCIVKIADFGIARLAPPPTGANTTAAGGLVGTADYVAPEQAHNPRTADHRADLYSLGCTFYFLLTGSPPFPGGTTLDKVHRHQFEAPVPVERARPDLHPAVAGIVHRLLAKEPNARFASAAALAEQIDGLVAAGALTEDAGHVNFELPAVRHGSYAVASGCLTGMHPTPTARRSVVPADIADTSPWAQLTEEITECRDADATAEAFDAATQTPPASRRPSTRTRLPRVAGAPPRGVSALTGLVLCGAVVAFCLVVGGYLLRVLTK